MELIGLHGVELDQTGACSEFGRIRSVLLWGLTLLVGFRLVLVAGEALPSAWEDVVAGLGSRGSARSDRAVPPTLEPDRPVALGRYRPYYRPPLESVGGSALSTSD
jgi:hypothetical protein